MVDIKKILQIINDKKNIIKVKIKQKNSITKLNKEEKIIKVWESKGHDFGNCIKKQRRRVNNKIKVRVESHC